MTIEDFLEILEQRELVPQKIIDQLRTKVQKGDRRITPKSLLKYLVKKELVTRRQAKELLQTTLTVSPNAESSILGMVPIPKLPQEEEPSSQTPEAQIPDAQTPEEAIPTIAPVEESPPSGVDLFSEQPSSLLADSLSKIGTNDPTLSEELEKSKLHEPEDPTKKRRKKKGAKKNEWDSSLLLLGGGGLALLLIAGVIIGYLLTRENADEVLALASEHFDGGSYTQAIKQYERFVDNHSGHPEFSAAKVKLGMARLWQASSGTSNFTGALQTAQQVLENIGDESEFNSAQRDLASLLPKISQGLANQAEKAAETGKAAPEQIKQLIEQVHASLSLCANTKYIPKTFRDEVLLGEVSQTLDRVQRTQTERVSLTQALAEIQTAVASNETAQAYQIHDSLLDAHPGLINNKQLAAKVLEISAAESAVVHYVDKPKAAETAPRPTQVIAELTLANRTGKAASATDDSTVAVRIAGAIYGLDSRDGSLRWRRFVGIAPTLPPVTLPSGNLLIVDDRHNELLKLDGKTGKLLWRQPFETPVSRPTLFGEKALVAEFAGKLHIIEISTGQRNGYVQFAQQLPTPPALDSQGRRIYITGEHSSLYTLSTQDYSCLGVFFLNHAKGSVTTPPIKVLNKVLVAVTKGLSTSHLEVLNTTDDGVPNKKAASQRLNGVVNTPLLSQGRRLVALTTRGQVAVYEVGAGTNDAALTKIATRDPDDGTPVARHGLLHQGHVWMAGTQLLKLAILPTSDRMKVSTLDHDHYGDTFDHPLQVQSNLLIHVRRPADKAGAIVAAVEAETGRSQWETELAVPTAGPPAADTTGMQIGAVTATGAAYLLDRQAMSRRVQDKAAQLASSRRKLPSLNHAIDLGKGRLLASAVDAQTLLLFRPGLPRGALKTIQLVGPLSCPPVLWQDAFVAPTATGQVFLYAADSGQQLGSPFQPALAPGVTYDWQSPAVYDNGTDSQLILSDSKNHVYLLSQVATPQPHLTTTAEVELRTSPLSTRFAVLENFALAGTSDGNLAIFELPSLADLPAPQLNAQITWGPFTVGKHIVFATATEELVCLDKQAKILWRQPFAHGPPTGLPISPSGDLVMLWQRGGLSRHPFSDGSEAAYLPLPQPAIAGPVPFGKRLVVSSYDGTLLIVDRP